MTIAGIIGGMTGGICAATDGGWLAGEVTGVPQLLQNALPVAIGCPQLTQNFGAGFAAGICGAPQELQNRTPSGMGAPQRLQVVLIASCCS
jgi:hypothetical protein